MSRRHKDPNVQAATPEKLRIEIDNIFRMFMDNEEMHQYEFIAELNNLQRKYIHEKAKKLNLQSKSHGKEPNRVLTIYKRKKLINFESIYLNLSDTSSHAISYNVAQMSPTVLQRVAASSGRKSEVGIVVGRIPYTRPVKVKLPFSNPLLEFRKTLPVFLMRKKILDLIDSHKVVIVSSETGSGKTTQIPQFLLEQAAERNTTCRIVCTQPRRISAVAVAERVAAERGEPIGATVGYSIRLESKMGPSTALYYCTNGVLLRTLMHDEKALFNISHVIVDEIHERDKFSDFLLIVLKAGMKRNPNLRVILMSATLKTEIYESYFDDAVSVSIPGRTFAIRELFLQDILQLTGYESIAMNRLRRERERIEVAVQQTEVDLNSLNLGNLLNVDMDDAIEQCVESGKEDNFEQLLQLIISEDGDPNYKHSETGHTGLMACAMHGNLEKAERLLYLGASVHIRCNHCKTALDYAQFNGHEPIFDLLIAVNHQQETIKQQLLPPQDHPSRHLLDDYDKTITDDNIDFDLIVKIIEFVHTTQQAGSILVFLPGYDDIMLCQEMILNSGLRMNELSLFLLHGSMQIGHQHDVFKPIKHKRKVILATNVAETSITIDDVVYVIDSGRAKEKTFDAISGIGTLQTTWISKACAKQRAGRAGRTRNGVCFHIYSRERFDAMQANRTPEILRVSLQELCLHTKKLAPPNMTIAAFLAQALEPPSSIAVQSSVQSLQALGALDHHEHLTALGDHLLQISAEPHLGKMLIYSTILKCVDPVLTIVACLAHKDPFVLPAQAKLRSLAQGMRKDLSFPYLSDHMCFIRIFQLWEEAKVTRSERQFCQKHFLSSAVMEMILQTRVQLMGQLRALGFVQPLPPDCIQNLNKYAHCWPIIKAVLSTGLYPNIAHVQNTKIMTRMEKHVTIHSSSCLYKYIEDRKRNAFHEWMMFEELSKTGQHCSIKCATVIAPIVIALMCGKATLLETDNISINIDDWLEFEPSNPDFYKYRLYVTDVINKRIINPIWHLSAKENDLLDSLSDVLTAEDAVIQLQHPDWIGQRPVLLQEQTFRGSRNNFAMATGNRRALHNGRGGRLRRPMQDDNRSVSSNGEPSWHDQNRFNSHASVRPRNGPGPGLEYVRPLYFKVPIEERLISDNVEFFVIKPNTVRNVDISVRQGKWTFAPQTERRVLRTFGHGKEVILFFSVQSVSSFVGIAKLTGTNGGIVNASCPIKWLCRVDLHYNHTRFLLNIMNNNRPVYLSKDGQFVENNIARQLYNMMFDTPIPDEQSRRTRPILGQSSSQSLMTT